MAPFVGSKLSTCEQGHDISESRAEEIHRKTIWC